MKEDKQKLTLDRPVKYLVTVSGELDDSWASWVGDMAIRVGSEGHTPPVTRLIGILNQADLHSLLRRLYALGLPLISDKWVDED